MRLHFLFAVYPVTEMIRLELEKNEKACLLNPTSTLPTHPGDHKPRLATWEGGEKSWEAPLPCSPVPGFDEACLLKAPGLWVPGQPHLPAYSCDGFLQFSSPTSAMNCCFWSVWPLFLVKDQGLHGGLGVRPG